VRTLAIAILLVGCGKGDDKPASDKPTDKGSATPVAIDPAKGAPGFERLKVTVDGKPVPMARAFIKRVSPDQWRLQVADNEGSCEELLSGVTNSQKGATSFVTTLRRRLTPDGGDTIAVTDFWTAGHPTEATFTTASIAGPTDKGKKVDLELAKIIDNDKGKVLIAEGAFTALGCGDQPAMDAGIPKDAHVSAASLTVAGKKIELVNAVLHGDELTLSSGPKDCSDVTPWSQVVLLHRVGSWTLSGTWFDKDYQSTDDTLKDLKVTFGAQGSGKDGATMAVTLAGAGKVGGYPVSLDGTIEAIDCPKPKK